MGCAGGVCIASADEVQSASDGLGYALWRSETQERDSSYRCAWQTIGNGYPLGGGLIATTREIAATILTTGWNFSVTLDGNPVSCADGHRCTDVLQEEKCRRSVTIGNYWIGEN